MPANPKRRKSFEERPEGCDCCEEGCACADCETCREPPVQVARPDPAHLQGLGPGKGKRKA